VACAISTTRRSRAAAEGGQSLPETGYLVRTIWRLDRSTTTASSTHGRGNDRWPVAAGSRGGRRSRTDRRTFGDQRRPDDREVAGTAGGDDLGRFRAYHSCPGETISPVRTNQKGISHALLPIASTGDHGSGRMRHGGTSEYDHNHLQPGDDNHDDVCVSGSGRTLCATSTSTTYASPAPGYMAPGSTSTTYATPAPGYMAPGSTSTSSTTYVTPGPGYMAPGGTTTVVRTQ